MTIRLELPAYIRTLIRGNHEEHDRIQAQLDAEGWDGFPRFLASLFFLAVERRFGESPAPTKVIKFVADLRADLVNGGPEINAEDAEALITATIDPEVEYDIDPSMIGKIQAATVYKILTDENIGDEELEAFLAEASELANRQ